jgi:hypothetical protein
MIRGNPRQPERVKGGLATGGLVHGTSGPGTEGVRPPSSNHQAAEGNYGPTVTTIPSPPARRDRNR